MISARYSEIPILEDFVKFSEVAHSKGYSKLCINKAKVLEHDPTVKVENISREYIKSRPEAVKPVQFWIQHINLVQNQLQEPKHHN